MKKTFYTIALTLITYLHYGQNYKDNYLFSDQIDSLYLSGFTPYQYQSLAVKYMEIGEFRRTLYMEDEFKLKYKGLKKGNISIDQSFDQYQAANAIEKLADRAKEHQIVIINEAHFNAQNRVFASALVKKLSKLGFNHLFLEGLNPVSCQCYDSLLNQRKYPLTSSGFYFKEPQYGNLIRNAFNAGMEVHAYEHEGNKEEPDPLKRWYSREEGQADNILRFLAQSPKSKIVIFCGYGHLGERIQDDEIIGMMSAVIKKKSGIDPFTISQTKMLETSFLTTNPFRDVLDAKDIVAPSIFVKNNGDMFSIDPTDHDVDVYFPPTKMINGRPDWLFLTKNTKSIKIPKDEIHLDYPCLVFAYHALEDMAQASPADVVELQNKFDYKTLVLQPGNYNLFIKDKKGTSQTLSLTVE